MMASSPAASQWAVQQIAEFLSAVSACPDADSAIDAAVEHCAEALEADVAAFLCDDAVTSSIGFSRGEAPVANLIALSKERGGFLEVPGVGPLNAIVSTLPEDEPGCMVVARGQDAPFDPSEVSLFRSMTRVLGMTLRSLRTLEQERRLRDSLQERQRLLERLTRIQRSISHRAPLQDVLGAITSGCRELIQDDIVGLRLIDPDDPGYSVLASASGLDDDLYERIRRGPVGEGAGGRAIEEERLVVLEDYQASTGTVGALAAANLQSAMAAPVYEEGQVVGSLVVASYVPGRRYSSSEREMLLALAEHASLALTDARTVDGMREAQRAKDMFLAMVSHELKTPLTVIMGTLRTVKTRAKSLPEELRDELLETSYERGEDLHRLIDMLLRGAQAQLAGRKDAADLGREIRRSLRGFETACPITVSPIPDRRVLIDRTSLRQIVGLLVENAIAHSPEGSPIRVNVAVEEPSLMLEVTNPGSLPPNLNVIELFEPFRRGPDATSSGVGLGLHIASKLASSMGGRIEARSTATEVTFTVWLPYEPVSASPATERSRLP